MVDFDWDKYSPIDNSWVPPEDRTKEMQRLHDEYCEEVQTFGDVGYNIGKVPDMVIMDVVPKQKFSKHVIRVWQTTGSCVGTSDAYSDQLAMVGDCVASEYRDGETDQIETIKPIFPFASYGVARRLMGARGAGSGCTGSAMSRACTPEYFGYLPHDDSRFPQPTVHDGPNESAQKWHKWTSKQELAWSHPRGWPMPESTLKIDADDFGIQQSTRAKNTDELVQGLAQFYPAVIASTFAAKNMRVEKGVLVGRWYGTWNHQQSITGYWYHPELGLLFLKANQWYWKAHPFCPVLSKLGIYGSYWTPASDVALEFKRGAEVFLKAGTHGFEERTDIPWEKIITFV